MLLLLLLHLLLLMFCRWHAAAAGPADCECLFGKPYWQPKLGAATYR
jgi:hypothetical protein